MICKLLRLLEPPRPLLDQARISQLAISTYEQRRETIRRSRP